MHKFSYKNFNCKFPSTWNELTKPQLIYVSGLFTQGFGKNQILVMSLRRFLGIPWAVFNNLNRTAIAEMLELIEFIVKPPTLTTQLIPNIKVHDNSVNISLKGPLAALQDVTFEQYFWHAEDCFMRFQQGNNEKFLNRMVASLYCINEFDSGRIDKVEALVSTIAPGIKFAVFIFFAGCRNFLVHKFPKVFSGKGGTGKQDDLASIRLLSSINDFDITKNPQIKRTNIYEALTNMEEMINHNEKIKAELKRKKLK